MTSETDFYCYAFSNGSAEFHPENTLTKFTAEFPFVLTKTVRDTQNWFAAIEKFGIALKFDSESGEKASRVIRIRSETIAPQYFNNGRSQDLAVVFPKKEDLGKYFFHTFQQKTYLPLESTNLRSFDFQILDANEQQLQLTPGTTTFVKIHFKKMNADKKSFFVRMTSAKSGNFPNNQQHSFKVRLPETIDVDSKWKVALSSINFPKNPKYYKKTENLEVRCYNRSAGGHPHIIRLPSDFNHNSFYTIFRKKLNRAPFEIDGWVDKNGYVVFYSKINIELHLHPRLSEMFGFENLPKKEAITGEVFDVVTVNAWYNSVGSKPLENQGAKPDFVMVYSNICALTAISSDYTQLLNVIPLREEPTTSDYETYDNKANLEFQRLQNTQLREIEIQLRSHSGEPLEFDTKDDVYISLEFSNNH